MTMRDDKWIRRMSGKWWMTQDTDMNGGIDR